MFANVLKNKSLLVTILILIIANIFFLFLPLVNVFGFEFSLVNALLLCSFSGLLRLVHFRKSDKKKQVSIIFSKQILILLFIPIVITFINSLFTGFCSFCDGVIFYFLITVVSAFIGVAIANLVYSFVKNIFSYFIFVLLILCILSIAVVEIYFNPQIYLYNPVFGYFPGTIYDEGLRPDWKLFFYRFANLSYFGLVFLLFRRSISITFKNKITRLGTVILIAFIFYYFSPSFGLTTTHSSLNNNLPVTFVSKNIILHTTKVDKEDSLLILSGEFYYSELQKFFELKIDKKITIWLFESGESKKKLFGSENADVAKPWLYEIYVSRNNWEKTLKHEMAHCFTAPFGSTIFKIASDFNPTLIEGAAESADGFYDDLPINYLAKTAFQNGFRVNIENLFLPGFNFFNQNSSLSYIYAGSFCRFLISENSIKKFKEFYKNGYDEHIYNEPLNKKVKEYETFLDTVNLKTKISTAEYYFGSPGIFSKYCPRYYEDKISEAWNNLNNQKYENAKEIFQSLLKNSNNYSALIGLATVYEKSNNIEKAINLIQEKSGDYKKSAYYYLLKLKLADLYIAQDEYTKAENLYRELYILDPSTRFGMIVRIRLALLEINKSSLKRYLDGSDYDKYSILKNLNKSGNKYFSFPVMIELSERLKEDYYLFLKYFENRFEVNDFWSSYAMLKLSEYMYNNLDLTNARKFSALSLRFNSDPVLLSFVKANSQKVEWSIQNSERVFENLKITE